MVVKNNLLNKIRSLKCYKLRYRDVQKVLGHCNFFKLYILYETTFFFKTFFQSKLLFDFDEIFTNKSENVSSFLWLF